MSLLEIQGLAHSFGDNTLYKDAELSLNKNEHLGIVGQNGSGKSTLVKICTGQILSDKGTLTWHPKVSVGYLDQYAEIDRNITINDYLKTAFSELYIIEEKLNKLYVNMNMASPKELELMTRYQEELDVNEFYFIDTKIAKIVAGLGLDAIGVNKPIGKMSGGQRAKIILAKLLLSNPDVLILDEPTNFLDIQHISWFKDYLSNFKNSFMIVSHDFDFLDSVTNCIVDIDNHKLKKYYGSYSSFLKKKAFLRENYIKQYTNQQKEIKKTEEFIRKNIAGRKSKMARGKRKQLNRMEKMEALSVKERKPNFHFKEAPLTSTEHLIVHNLSVGYAYPLLENIKFCIKGGEKIVITGFNGVGKSTLLKTLVGQNRALGGNLTFSQQVVLGYFEQELKWENTDMTPIEIILNFYPKFTNKEAYNKLAACGIPGKLAIQPISTLSGGEQVKLKLCILLQKKYNFVILDEPTNHLDKIAKEALKEAIVDFKGTAIIVSHEKEFYNSCADRVINIEESIVKRKDNKAR